MSPSPPREDGVAVANATTHETQEMEDPSKKVKFSRVLLIAIVLCLATFCVAVDNTIISTAVPRITHDFHSIDDVGWYAA